MFGLHLGLALTGTISGGLALPLDTVPGALAAWGLVPLKATMIGQNGFKLRRTADAATADFVFSGAATPKTAVDAWKGAETTYNARKACFDTIYDQVATNHLTQSTANSQPAWLELPDGRVVAALDGDNLVRDGFWSIPDMSLGGRNVTVYHVFQGNDRTWSGSATEAAAQYPTFGWLITGGYAGWSGTESPSFRVLARSWRGGSFDDNYCRPSNCHAQIAALRWNGTNTLYSLNDAVTSTTGVQVNGTLTSGRIGRLATFGIYSRSSQWLATLVYPAHTTDEMNATIAALRACFNLAAWTHNIVFDGDSITSGHTENEGSFDVRYRAWPAELHASINNPALRFSNTAISSQTLATMQTNAANKIDVNYSAGIFGANNILVVFAGTNDINAGADATTTISRLTTYFNSRRTAGWNKIILCTAIPRENFTGTQNGHLATYNAFVTANTLGADAVVDLAALGWAFGTHYQGTTPNRIHPNAAGRLLIVAAVQAALEPMVN